jgi:PIN domain nuclease of toxin-antitoxin system
MAPIPSPTATDPIVSSLDDSSELTVIGKMIATQFGLTITDNEATCLGLALSDTYDVSSTDTDNAQYQRQFQRAFDNCAIDFTISSQ